MSKITKFEINEKDKEITIDWHFTDKVVELLTERPFRIENGYACGIMYEINRLIEKVKEIWISQGVSKGDIKVIDKRIYK